MKWTGRLLLLLIALTLATEFAWFSARPEQRLRWLTHWPLLLFPSLVTDKPLLPQLLRLGSSSAFDLPQAVLQQPPPDVPAQSRLNAQTQDSVRGWHGFSDQCFKPATQDVHDVQSTSIYRWTDEQGNVHFSDKAKGPAQDLTKQYRPDLQGVRFTFEYPGWAGNAELEQALRKEGELLYRILTRFIPREAWRQINLDILLFDSEAAYTDYKNRHQMAEDWAAHYSHGVNRIFMPVSPERSRTLAVGRHEMTHAMVAGMIGTLPTWLSEGLAEDMERLDWQMNAARVTMNEATIAQVARQRLPLVDILNMAHEDFSASDMQAHYRQSAVLVFYLLAHAQGQTWLRGQLAYYVEHPCAQLDARSAFAAYPGGLAQLDSGFTRWLHNSHFEPHYY